MLLFPLALLLMMLKYPYCPEVDSEVDVEVGADFEVLRVVLWCCDHRGR